MEEPGNNIENYEKVEDASYDVGKLAINIILPGIGPVITTAMDIIYGPPFQKRVKQFMDATNERFNWLEEHGLIDIPSLATNDQFIDVLMQIAPYYVKTSIEEKKTAFLNALSNTAIQPDLDATKTEIFLKLIDSFTVWHINTLAFCSNPKEWLAKANIAPKQFNSWTTFQEIIIGAFPNFPESVVGEIILQELKTNGILDLINLSSTVSAQDAYAPRITPLGIGFLDFISFDRPLA